MRGILPAFLLVLATAASAAPQVEATPESVVLGQDLEVRIRVSGVDRTRPLRHAVSAGTLSPASGGDEHTFVWTPPEIRYPTRAILLFWQEGPSPDPTVLQIPLLGRTELEMTTDPGAEVRVYVGATEFGPTQANARGRVQVPIEVPPGVFEAEAVATSRGRTTTRKVPLDVPETWPVAIGLSPDPVPSNGGWVLVGYGEELAPDAVTIAAEGATVSVLSTGADHAVYRVLPDEGAQAVKVEARVHGASAASVEAKVGPEAQHVAGPSTPLVPPTQGRLSLQGQVGFFVSGGANLGPLLELGAAYRLPGLDERIFLELAVGLRSAGLTEEVAGLGELSSDVLAFPVTAGARARLFRSGPWAVDLRAGISAVPFRHSASAPFQASFAEGGVGFGAFGGAQGSFAFGPLELFTDLRGDFTRVRTPHLIAHPGGLVFGLGARYALP